MRPFNGPGSLGHLYKIKEEAETRRQLETKQQEQHEIKRTMKLIFELNVTRLEDDFLETISDDLDHKKINSDNIKDIVKCTSNDDIKQFLHAISNSFLYSTAMKKYKGKEFRNCASQIVKEYYQELYDTPQTSPTRIEKISNIVDSRSSTPLTYHDSR